MKHTSEARKSAMADMKKEKIKVTYLTKQRAILNMPKLCNILTLDRLTQLVDAAV